MSILGHREPWLVATRGIGFLEVLNTIPTSGLQRDYLCTACCTEEWILNITAGAILYIAQKFIYYPYMYIYIYITYTHIYLMINFITLVRKLPSFPSELLSALNSV